MDVVSTLCVLPNELLNKIFSLLPQKDHHAVGLVSNRFQIIIDQIKCAEESILEISEQNVQVIKTGIENKNCNLSFKRVKLEDVTNIEAVKLILQSIGKQIEHLSMKNTAAFEILKCNVINLRSIELYFDDILERSVNNTTFNLRSFPYLEKLIFLKNTVATTKQLLEQIKGPNTVMSLKHLKMECVSENENDIVAALLHHTDTLETLDIYLHTSNINLKILFLSLNNLKNLSLSGNVNEEMFNSLLNMPKENSLEHLGLNGKSCKLTDEILILIAEKWRGSLQRFELCGQNITDVGVVELGKLTILRHLQLSNCDKITKIGLLMGIALEINFYLQELHLENLPKLDELGLRVMLSRFPNLRVLKLHNIVKAVTNTSLASIFRYQIHLRSLSINYCFDITDECFIGFGENPYSINRLHFLKELKLNRCRKLTDQTLIKALHLPELRTLKLERCLKITLKGIESMLKNCPSLEVLSIPSTAMIDDNTLFVIGNGLKRIRQLHVTDCDILTVNLRNRMRDVFFELKNNNNNNCFANDCKLKMSN